MHYKIAAAAFVAAGALTLAGGSAALASVKPADLNTTAPEFNSIGTTGYDAIGGPFHSVGAIVTTSPAADNIGGVGTGGIGVQLCDPNNGYGLQLGLVQTGTSSKPTFSVDYQAGTLAGAAADSCVGNGVLPEPKTLNANLTGLANGDAVALYISYYKGSKSVWIEGHWVPGKWVGSGKGRHWVQGFWVPGHHERVATGKALFQAFDETAGFEVYSATLNVPAGEWFDNAGAGVEQNTTLVSANTPVVDYFAPAFVSGADNPVASFTETGVNSYAWYEAGTGFADYFSNEVVSSPGSLAANPTLADAGNTLAPTTGSSPSSFQVFAGNPS